jgi:general secretion pathway protein G
MNYRRCKMPSIRISSHSAALLSRPAGYTLIELVFVVMLIGILCTFALFFYGSIKDRARTAAATVEIADMGKLITAYSIDNGGRYPSDLADIGRSGFKDPWGTLYQYHNILNDHSVARLGPFEALNTDYDLYSNGPDQANDLDDIVRAADGSFVGLNSDLM